MTDSSSLGLNLQKGIPSDLDYRPAAIAPRGRAFENSVTPSNASTFAASSLCILEIPSARSNTFLDGASLALRFTVQFTSSGTIDADTYVSVNDMANSFIDTVSVYAGGVLVDQINNYGSIANAVMNIAMTSSQKANLGWSIGADSLGGTYGHTILIGTTPGSYRRTFVLPLMGFLSSTKMLDVSQILTGLRIEITWASTTNSYCKWKTAYGTAPNASTVISHQIQDVQLIHTMVELEAEGAAMVDALRNPDGSTLYFGKSFRSTNFVLPSATSGMVTVPGNQRLSSIVALHSRFRTKSSAVNGNPLSSANPNLGSYSFRIGSVQVPQREVNLDGTTEGGYAHAFSRVLQAHNSFGTSYAGCALGWFPPAVSTTGVPSLANGTSVYCTRNSGATTAFGILDDNNCLGTFMVSADTELFPNRNSLLSGVSTLASPFYLNLNITEALTDSTNIDLFAHYDIIMIVRNGQVQVIV